METRDHLSAIVLNSRDPRGLAAFYCDALGMARYSHKEGIAVGYGKQGALLVFRLVSGGATNQPTTDSRYWKIAITVPNLDLASTKLARSGVAVSAPRQFQEIAYLNHIADPEGNIVELIQHTFEGKPRTSEGNAMMPLGGGAQIGLITLRTNDIDAEKLYFLDKLGMTYLSRQAVSQMGFDLYFFAFADERQPDHDVDAVVNREWLWQRPYTTLEFQHRLDGRPIIAVGSNQFGAVRIIVESGDGTQIAFS